MVLEVFRKKKVVFRIGDTQMDKTQEVGPTKKEQILKVCLVKIKIKNIELSCRFQSTFGAEAPE